MIHELKEDYYITCKVYRNDNKWVVRIEGLPDFKVIADNGIMVVEAPISGDRYRMPVIIKE